MSRERRREHLIEAALELYGRMPPEQVGVEDVTRAADVSRALFYRYFHTMDELHVAALERVVAEMLTRVSLHPGGDVRGALGAFLDVAQRHSRAYVALLRSGSVISTGETDTLVDGVREHIVGLLTAPGAPPLQLMTVRGWVAVVEGACLTWLQDPAVPREELLDWLAGQLTAMLAVTAGRVPS